MLNRTLQLGLFDFECHFACYPAGAHYARHNDQFQGDSDRELSCVLYLNENWKREDGGQLRLHLDSGDTAPKDILPRGGRLVMFISRRFAHEVLPAARERFSIAGWFKTRAT
jgi:SM-20-related protein